MSKMQKVMATLTLILALALLMISLSAVLIDDGGSPYNTMSIRGEMVEIYGGSGIYTYNTVEKALMMRAYDWYYLAAGVPLLFIGLMLYLRKSYLGYFILLSTLFFLIYNFIITSIAISFNQFFLAYMAIYVISVFSVIFMMKEISFPDFQEKIMPKLPIKTIAFFMLFLAAYFIIS